MFLFLLWSCTFVNKSATMSPLRVNVYNDKQADIRVIGKTKGESVRSVCFGIFTSNQDNHFVDNPSFSTYSNSSFGFFSANPVSKQKSAATYKALQKKNGDILLAPMYTIRTEKGLICTKTIVQVTGYAAKMMGFVGTNEKSYSQKPQPEPTIISEKPKEQPKKKTLTPILPVEKIVKVPKELKKEEKVEKIVVKESAPSPKKAVSEQNISSTDNHFSLSILQTVGSINTENIPLAFFDSKRKLNTCFQKSNEDSIDISIFLLIQSTGRVISYNLLNSSSEDDSFISCVLNDITNLRFSSFTGISNLRVKLSSIPKETK